MTEYKESDNQNYNNNRKLTPLFASIDVETDGPNIMRHSMRALAIVFMNSDKKWIDYFYVHLTPQPNHSPDPKTMQRFWSKFPEQWNHIQTFTVTPQEAMAMLAIKLKELYEHYAVKWVGKPSSVDFAWLKCYYETYGPTCKKPNLGHFAHCLQSLLIFYRKQKNISDQNKMHFLNSLSENSTYSHNALEDAYCQAIMYINLRQLVDLESSHIQTMMSNQDVY
jgi:hypothetical protein